MDSTLGMLLYFGIFGLIIYFLMIRPQSKKQKEFRSMIESLKVKDKVITAGGIHGTITKVKEDSAIIRIAEKVEIEIEKGSIGRITNRDITADKKGKGKNSKVEEQSEPEKLEEPVNENTESDKAI